MVMWRHYTLATWCKNIIAPVAIIVFWSVIGFSASKTAEKCAINFKKLSKSAPKVLWQLEKTSESRIYELSKNSGSGSRKFIIRGLKEEVPVSSSETFTLVIEADGRAHVMESEKWSVKELKQGELPKGWDDFGSLHRPFSPIIEINEKRAREMVCGNFDGLIKSNLLNKVKESIARSMAEKNTKLKTAVGSLCASSLFIGSLYPTLVGLRDYGIRNAISLHGSNFTFELLGLALVDACMRLASGDPRLKKFQLAAVALGGTIGNFGSEYKTDDIIPGSKITQTDTGDLISGQIGILTYVSTAILLEQKYGRSIKEICR